MFDKETITEELCERVESDDDDEEHDADHGQGGEQPEGKWIWRRKELNTAWSFLSECGCGQFGPSNTVHLEEMPDLSSHPDNVIQVPEWGHVEDGAPMATLKEYLRNLVRDKPGNVPDYLKNRPPSNHPQRPSIFEKWKTRRRQSQSELLQPALVCPEADADYLDNFMPTHAPLDTSPVACQ